MRGSGLSQPPDQADLVVELGPERVDEDRLQAGLLGGEAKALGKLPAIDRPVVDDREKLGCPHAREQAAGRLALAVGARPQPVDQPAGLVPAVGEAVGPDADRDHRDAGAR